MIASDRKSLILELGHRVIGIARTRAEALKLAASTRPGLILADIQLADGSNGIDAVDEIHLTCTAPAVFITAYPERLLTGRHGASPPIFWRSPSTSMPFESL